MPRTLPISRSRGRTVDRTTSTTRLCFSSTTPVSTANPNEKMPMRIRTVPMLAKTNVADSSSVSGSRAAGCGGTWASARATWSTSLSASTSPTRRPTMALPMSALRN